MLVRFLACCLLLRAVYAQAQQFDGTETGEGFPFKLRSGFLIVVEGRIGTVRNLKFALDTGVTRSIVDRKIADKFSLIRHPRAIFAFDRVVGAEAATFPEVQFGAIQVANVPMLIANLVDFSTFANDVDAIIGSDFLRLGTFTIDYDAKKMLFRSIDSLEAADAGKSNPGLLIVELWVQGQQLRFLVDSGFPDILLFEDRLRKRAPQVRVEHEMNRFCIGDRLHAKRAILPKTCLGAREKAVAVLMVEGPPDNVLPGIIGLLGIASLKAHRIVFNYASNRLAWH
jgi:predicted aspartyl protease